ncbi:DeoR/GlpR family DNA-binding transcription regulator [Feifania hominis]|uniref:DeoR/GlpR transcriptional regulator n=1 Tax=Feifania hominis TaxID=2763660 RepID=A0A926DCM0_9FIRM|nr:DeoR/GlpR family DNA-binding transcription regulator [Feifania hominis]MBC8535359.1 DeoR/GlpR transcriptional regulator [Feifania hominis]
MSKKTQRIEQIIGYLKVNNGASIKEIADMLGVSEMTVRRDLYELREQNVINYISGVAIYNPENADVVDKRNYELSDEKLVNEEKKIRIGKAAAAMIEPGDIIIIDTGTTTEKLVRYIDDDLAITVLCYNANTMFEMLKKKSSNILFAGGVYHANTQMFESPEGINLIRRTRATKVFISAAGVSENLGITCANLYEVETKRAIIESGLKHILLVDSSKFDKIRPAFFAPLSKIDAIITDSGVSEEWVDKIHRMSIELQIV